MRVLYLPYYGDSNEYQNLLTNAVAERGVTPIEGTMHLLFPLTRNVLAADRPDVLHLIWTHPFFIVGDYTGSNVLDAVASYGRALLFVLDLLIVHLLGVDVVWTVHNKHNHEKHHLRLDRTVNRFVGRIADELTVECAAAKSTVVDLFGVDESKINVVSEGSYVGTYPDDADRESSRARLGLDEETFVFVYFGMIRRYKGLPDLLDAFEALDEPAVLYVAGNPYTETIDREIRTRIDAMPNVEARLEFIPNDEVQYYMRAADVVTLPYRDIMTSGSVLLAMSFGRPVVTPAMGCIPAVLPDDDSAFLYDQGDEESLRTALRTARSTPRDELAAMGRRNYERALDLDWDDIGDDTVDIYRRAST
ncbi:glycosyltransferase [Haloplanus litoreus]|uniref:Glycosyltransferase n=1 Tax=Haloplanus litoreus TaxID=767515 RepID=A0ABD5ZY29_9EURY